MRVAVFFGIRAFLNCACGETAVAMLAISQRELPWPRGEGGEPAIDHFVIAVTPAEAPRRQTACIRRRYFSAKQPPQGDWSCSQLHSLSSRSRLHCLDSSLWSWTPEQSTNRGFFLISGSSSDPKPQTPHGSPWRRVSSPQRSDGAAHGGVRQVIMAAGRVS
jgi:hypothetical protein